MIETAPQTRSDWVYERLKHAIVSGELTPGARLVAAELAQRWALSPTPLREAFQRLEGVGLVELSSQRGARVDRDRPSAGGHLGRCAAEDRRELVEHAAVVADVNRVVGEIIKRR